MKKAQAINLIVERAESGERLDSLAVACAVARDLRTDDVQRWADEVQSVIADCERLRQSEQAAKPVDPDAPERRAILAEMAKLEAKLDALGYSSTDSPAGTATCPRQRTTAGVGDNDGAL